MHRQKYKQNNIIHICNKSIANYNIFKDSKNCDRFIKSLIYYNNLDRKHPLSLYLRNKNKFKTLNLLKLNKNSSLKFLAYCIMPDHYHILIKLLKDNILSKYISDVENSFSRYFNSKFYRKGPIWQSRFKSVLIKNDNQLLHLTRYIHLNPTTSNLVKKPEEWPFSSYKYYLKRNYLKDSLKEISIISPYKYKEFCENHIDYQKKLKIIKKSILE
jgi:putative transposase